MLQLPKPDLFIVGDTSGIHVISLLARVLIARDPLITRPPSESIAWQKAGDPGVAEDVTRALHAAANDPFFMRVRTGVEPPKIEGLPSNYQPWILAASNLGLASLLSFPRVHVSEVDDLMEALTKLAQPEGHTIGDGSAPIKTLIDTDPMREPFAQMALTMNYERLIKSGLFDRLAPVEVQGDKGPSAIAQRGLLLATLMRILAMQTPLLRIRPLLRFLRTPQSMTRIREEMEGSRVEHWESLIDRILKHPVHPWIAKAEEASLPTSRMTAWGDASPTILLERDFLKSPWNGDGNPTAGERETFARAMKDRLDAPQLLEKMMPTIKELRRYLDDIEDGARGPKITALLGFTLPSSPIQIPLWGGSFKPVHYDGLNTSEPVADLIAASYGIHLPARTSSASPWIGEEGFVPYSGASRMDGDGLPWGAFSAQVYLSPEDVIVDTSFHVKRNSPDMLRFVSDGYQGDLTAYTFPATVKDVAAVFGRSEVEMATEILANSIAWRHIFTLTETKGGREIRAAKNEPVFYSDRTKMPWLRPITLPRMGVPTVMWGMRRGLPDTCLAVQGRFLRDPQIPLPSIPLTGAVDKLVDLAISAQLAGVMK
jgi:hypothetical protein